MPVTGTPLPSGPATGLIIDEDGLTRYMGSVNLAIMSQQNNAATSNDSTNIQGGISRGEGMAYSVLLQLRCKAGTFFKFPFTVGGVPLKSSGSIIGLPVLQEVCHQLAVDQLNEWRVLQSAAEAESESAITARVRDEKSRAEQTLRKIIRWAQGYTDGQYVDLDLTPGAVVGQIYQVVSAPVFAGATVDKNGLPERRIINPAGLPWWGVVPNPWCFISE